jgi:alkylation response protein AidB-like acyl-CoA dehydrogenase
MNLSFTAEEDEFRSEVRTWLEENVPHESPGYSVAEQCAFDLSWQQTLAASGWAGITWPTAFGGRGLPLMHQLVWYEEYARAQAPVLDSLYVTLNHAGPTLIARGTEEQQRAHLENMLHGRERWSQGFSEPNAGSDLAAISTTGVIDGDDIVVSGSKIWTSYANHSTYQELLVRTDPSGARHRGLTWLIGNVSVPGVEVRPIRTLTGFEHFCEVFYDEARFPLSSVVGDINDGWSVAMATLGFERGPGFMLRQISLARSVKELARLASRVQGPDGAKRAIDDADIAGRLADVEMGVRALRAFVYRTVSAAAQTGGGIGAEASIGKLALAELSQSIERLAMDILGLESLERPDDHDDWTTRYLEGLRTTISAGSSDVQRNIIGQRYLGLPRAS